MKVMRTINDNKVEVEKSSKEVYYYLRGHRSEDHFNNRFNDLYDSPAEIESSLNRQSLNDMWSGQIPNLWDSCQVFINLINKPERLFSAIQFITAFNQIPVFNKSEINRYLNNKDMRHVLISNKFFELILIHWKPGKVSEIHGHSGKSCLFKVLYGRLEEVFYSPDKNSNILGCTSHRNGSISYIDDNMAYHQVSNPYGSSAISLHANLKQ